MVVYPPLSAILSRLTKIFIFGPLLLKLYLKVLREYLPLPPKREKVRRTGTDVVGNIFFNRTSVPCLSSWDLAVSHERHVGSYSVNSKGLGVEKVGVLHPFSWKETIL